MSRRKVYARDVLMDLLDNRVLTAADLVAITGLKPATVTTALYQLRQGGMLSTDTIRRKSKKGRPRVLYTLAPVAA